MPEFSPLRRPRLSHGPGRLERVKLRLLRVQVLDYAWHVNLG